VIDSFIVGPSSDHLKGMTLACGGYAFMPMSVQEGVKLFEWETLLSAYNRE
jgi:hypothetical protein